MVKNKPVTPLPWQYDAIYVPSIWPEGRRGLKSAICCDMHEDDAKYATYAANAYPTLVEALKAVLKHPCCICVTDRCKCGFDSANTKADAALRAAGEME